MRGTKPFQTIVRDTSSVNITGTFSELEAALDGDCSKIAFASSVAMQLIIGTGASGSETNLIVLAFAINNTGVVNILIPKDTRLVVKSLTGGTISSGIAGITFLN